MEVTPEKIRMQVEAGFKRRNSDFIRATFESHKNVTKNGVLSSSLGPALNNLGLVVDPSEIDEILKSRDLNSDGVLNFQEFLSLVSTPSQVEEWVGGLPLTQMVSDALPRVAGLGADQLRHLSNATLKDLEVSCEIIKEGLLQTLQEKLAVLKTAYKKLDSQTAAGSNTKFQISKMSVGSIADFHKGLTTRIGERHP
jgi:hypothetical protein